MAAMVGMRRVARCTGSYDWCVTSVPSVPQSPEVAVAVLYERLGYVVERLERLSAKIDEHNVARTEVLNDLERRVQHVEKAIDRTRWFVAGVAAGGGALGGGIAAFIAQALGG